LARSAQSVTQAKSLLTALLPKAPPSSPCSECDSIDPACWDPVVPLEARFLEVCNLRTVSDIGEFRLAASRAFDEIDIRCKGTLDRVDLEVLVRTRMFASCTPQVWAATTDQLCEKILGSGVGQVARADFVAAVDAIADTLDRRVWPLATSQFLSALMFSVSQPLMPLLVTDLGISMAQFGGMVALMPLVRIALAVPVTSFANRYGRKPLTVEGQLLAAVGLGSSALISSPLQLMMSRIIVGAGTSCAGTGQQSMLADISIGRSRSRIFAPGLMRVSAAFAVGPAIGGILASNLGVQSTYVLVGMGMALVSIKNRYSLQETLTQRGSDESQAKTGFQALLKTSRQLVKDPGLLAVTLANLGFNFTSVSSRFVLLPMLALDTWGLGALGLGATLGAMSLAQFAAARPAAYIADVYGRKAALLPGLGLTAASMGLAVSVPGGDLMLPLACGGWALGTSLVGSVPSALALDGAARLGLDQQETTRLLAMSRVISDLGMATGCVASGLLLQSFGMGGAFSIQAGVLAAVTAATARAVWRM